MAVPGRDPGISPGHPAFRPDGPHPEEPLQAASRRRSSALFRTLLRDAASRLLRMRASETIGITARDTLCRHGRACAGHPDPVRLGASRIGITGTSPVMTAEGAVGGCEGRTYPPIHAVSLTALILRSRCKRRLEGGSGEHRKRAVLRDASLLRRAPICGFPHRHGRAGPGHPDQTSAAFPSSGSPAPIPGPSPGRGRGEAGHDDIRHAPAPRSRPDPRSFPAREQSVRQTAPGPVPRRRAMFTPSARRKIIFPPFTTHMIEESRLIPP
jgi:hypothetical protein